MAVLATVVVDAFDLGAKAHVEHPVCFIKDEVGHSFEVCNFASVLGQNVDHSSRGADDNFDPIFEFANLVGNVVASNDTADSLLDALAEAFCFCLNLEC